MKVGFVLSQPFGKSIGTDVRISGLLEGLARLGVEIHLITLFPETVPIESKNIIVYSSSDLKSKFSSTAFNFYRNLGNHPFLFRKFLSSKSMVTFNNSSISNSIYNIVRDLELDVLQAEQPIASLACIKLKDKLDVPVIADFHGIWAEELVASGLIQYGDSSYNTIFELEAEICTSADSILVVSEEMKNYLVKSFNCSSNKISLIPNATFLRFESPKRVGHASKVIHSGTLHPWENVELFVESIPFVSKNYSDARFFITKKGAKLEKIQNLARNLGVNPEFFWVNDNSAFFEFLRSCDVGVISSTAHIARQMAYPAKLYDYLSVGLPIVANDIGGWTGIIKRYKLGIVTDNNPKAYADGILELLNNPDLIYEYGQNGIDLVRRSMNYDESAKLLLQVYERLGQS
jgi:glycosyltransferase involved in cell wall biosynthesis